MTNRSKSLLVVLLVLLALSFCSAAVDPRKQELSWSPSPTTNINIYVLYHGTNEFALNNKVAVTNYDWGTNLIASITNGWFKTNFVAGVTNWLGLVAKDDLGMESELSNVIPYAPPKPPALLRLFLQVAPTIDGPWRTLTNPPVELLMDEPVLFSRVLHERTQ